MLNTKRGFTPSPFSQIFCNTTSKSAVYPCYGRMLYYSSAAHHEYAVPLNPLDFYFHHTTIRSYYGTDSQVDS